MKKKTSLVLFILSILSYIPWYLYRKDYFVLINENGANISYFIGYIFIWFVALFILSIFALKLENTKYKNWLITSIVVAVLSVFWAYKNDLTGNAVVTIDGGITTVFAISLYSFVSVVYFIIDFFKNRNK
jgi:hypothetical protein